MLELDLTTIIFEILNFLILSVGLYFLLFRPVIRRVEQRGAEKEKLINDTRKQLEDAQLLKSDLEARLAHLDEEVSQLMDEAREKIAHERQQMLEAVRIEAGEMRKNAEIDIRRYQRQEIQQFNERLLNTLIALSGELIEKVSPPEVHDKLVQETNEYVWNLGRDKPREVETLRKSLGDRTPTVHIATAYPLKPDQQRMLARTFSALTDRNVNFELETNPDLYCGVRIRVGDILVDNSIAAQLDQMRSEMGDELIKVFADGG